MPTTANKTPLSSGPTDSEDGDPPGWTALQELPGIEFAWTSASSRYPERFFHRESTPQRPTAASWAQLQTSLAGRIAQELDLGQPRVMVTVHDQRLLVVGIADETQTAVVLQDPASAGMAIVRVRQWIELQQEPQTPKDPS
ncbi:MAG: hypothetical protein ACRBN8_17535 [Nannocystales bacterium]